METFLSGGWKQIRRGEVYIGGAWRRLSRIEGYVSSDWKRLASFALPLTVSANSPSGTASSDNVVRVRSANSTAVPSGGVSPFTYLWAVTSGPASLTTNGNATVAFSQNLGPNQESVSTARVTCTDLAGTTAVADIVVSLANLGSGPPV